jgi:DNA-binding CsgD family transcriptional regulator
VAITPTVRSGVRSDITRLVHRGLGLQDFGRSAGRILRRAVRFDGICLLTLDPATLLPTGELVDDGLPVAALPRLTEIELREPDFNKFTALARSPGPAASLHEATAGELDRSVRQRELRRPSGFQDELRAALPGTSGTCGALTLLRAGAPDFTRAEVRLVASLAALLAEGLQRAVLLHEGADVPEDVGLLVLGPDDTIRMADRAAERWLEELSPPGPPADVLPAVVRAVAQRAREVPGETAAEAGGRRDGTAAVSEDRAARARVRTAGGQWLVVRGSQLSAVDGDADGDGDEPIAVLFEPARPAELAPLIADAYGLTARERRVTELVARGLRTDEIARRLHLSPLTVQDHLKSIFEKSGAGSRGDLVARLFFDHHAPHLGPEPVRAPVPRTSA